MDFCRAMPESPPDLSYADPTQASLRPLRVILAGPRGFCAGVDRAIRVVEEALRRYGAPVYVRHEIVHNRTVVEALEAQGAIFVEELDEVPENAHVVFSAHGVPKSVPEEAQRRKLAYLDATCPLVSKVHREAERHFIERRHILMIGHAGHPEVVGTMGQLPQGAVTLVQNAAEAASVAPGTIEDLAFITQTTLSVDDTAEIIDILRRRFPAIEGPKREDICYATTNRQAAVKAIAQACELLIVIGSPNSSNSQRLARGGRTRRRRTRDPGAQGRRARFLGIRQCQHRRHHRWRIGPGKPGPGSAGFPVFPLRAGNRGTPGHSGRCDLQTSLPLGVTNRIQIISGLDPGLRAGQRGRTASSARCQATRLPAGAMHRLQD